MMSTKTTKSDPARPRARHAGTLSALLLLALTACGPAVEEAADDHAHHGEEETWSVTAWGEGYEIFPAVAPLAAGESAEAHVHVTRLDGFAPLEAGEVEIVLTPAEGSGREERFSASAPDRPGIFAVELTPERTGDFDLAFRVNGPDGTETIRGGRVRVGTPGEPGGVVRAPAPRGTTGGGEPVPFLKEQQWRADFATDWVRRAPFARSVEGQATVRPVAGGESWVTAPVAGTLRPEPWPWPGRAMPAEAPLFRLVPSVAEGASLADLRADASAFRDELAEAESRLARLERLLEVEATSQREVEAARTRVVVLRARVVAADDDLESASAVREGRGSGSAVTLRAPFEGRIARVEASPGERVEAGDRLARLVRVDRVWLEVALPPAAAGSVSGGIDGVVLRGADGGPEIRFTGDEVELVSMAPEVDPATGRLPALVEVPGRGALVLGSVHSARLLLASDAGSEDRSGETGIPVPASALVDDGGVTVVYLQLGGERFVRQEVQVLERQGDRVLVAGLVPGQRLVTRGGDAIRRETLVSSGAGEGHIH